MKRFSIFIFAVATLFSAAGSEIPWKLPTYTLVARDMDLRVAFDTFAVAEGLSVVMSDSVRGVFSGDFRDVAPSEFLDKIAVTHNLIWYYDGAALYVYGAGEIATILLDLKYMKAGEVRAMLDELGVEDARFPIKTTSNDELMMVSGPPRYVSLVAETVAKADRLREMRTFNEVEIRLFPLINTWADDVSFSVSSTESSGTIKGVANLLNDIMNSMDGRSHDSVGTNYVDSAKTPIEDAMTASFRPMIKAENRLNAVLVRDVKSRLPMYEELIRQLDVPQKLVEIGVTVVELSKNDALDWQLSLKAEGTKKRTTGAAGQNAANLVEPAALGGQGLAGALTYLGKEVTVSASLSALKAKGKARSISRTSLITMNNLAAEMTDTQSYHTKVVGTEVATLQEVSAGTKLQIKPRIILSPSTNVANQIWLTMELDDGGFESISVDSMPMTRSSKLMTQIAVFENESIMLAGYLRDIEEEAGWGIPYLRDIPFIGWLFGGSSTRKETVQRMFILTPHTVDLDTEMLMRLQAVRLRDVAEEEIVQDDAEDYDIERRQREIERKDVRERRRAKADIRYEHSKAEVEHNQEMRDIERERAKDLLKDEKREWHEAEQEALEELREERKAKKEAESRKEAEDK